MHASDRSPLHLPLPRWAAGSGQQTAGSRHLHGRCSTVEDTRHAISKVSPHSFGTYFHWQHDRGFHPWRTSRHRQFYPGHWYENGIPTTLFSARTLIIARGLDPVGFISAVLHQTECWQVQMGSGSQSLVEYHRPTEHISSPHMEHPQTGLDLMANLLLPQDAVPNLARRS